VSQHENEIRIIKKVRTKRKAIRKHDGMMKMMMMMMMPIRGMVVITVEILCAIRSVVPKSNGRNTVNAKHLFSNSTMVPSNRFESQNAGCGGADI
jgi:hypothetical protein